MTEWKRNGRGGGGSTDGWEPARVRNMKRFCSAFTSLLTSLPVAALLLGTASKPLAAQETSVNPGINESYKSPDLNPDEWKQRFETESREVYAFRDKIMEETGFGEGWAVADIGAGTGLFTLLLSEKVGPEGTVYAVDIATPFLASVHNRAREAGRDNVKTVLCTDRDSKLSPESVSGVFISDTYHHFEYPEQTMASIHRAMKPGGILVLIDFKRIEGESSDWILNHVRAGQEVFVQEVLDAGFEILDEKDFLDENYYVRFRKKD